MGSQFVEKHQIVAGFLPVDMQTGANSGDYVSLKGWGKCTVVFYKDAGTAGDDPTLNFQQATAVDGSGAKDLTKVATIHTKQGADLFTVGQYTKVTQTPATSYTDATSAEVEAIWVVDINAEDLDVDNGFDCLAVDVADVGANAQLGCVLYILSDPRYPQAIVDSAIAD